MYISQYTDTDVDLLNWVLFSASVVFQVIDLLVKILQCPLDGAVDEMNLVQVFKEAYEILYTYMIGKSRKNALYFAKYIEFFQTQFTQKVRYHAHICCNAIILMNKHFYDYGNW